MAPWDSSGQGMGVQSRISAIGATISGDMLHVVFRGDPCLANA